VFVREEPIGILLKLTGQSVFGFLRSLYHGRLDPAEFLLVRDELDLQRWSLLIGLSPPETIALCLMAKYDRSRFEALILLSQKINTEVQGDVHNEMVTDLLGRYLSEIRSRLLSAGIARRLHELSGWTPIELMYRRQKSGLNLSNFFLLAQQLKADSLSLVFSWPPKAIFLLTHWARFDPEGLEALAERLDPIPRPDGFRTESSRLSHLTALLDREIADYMLAQQQLLSGLSFESEYTDEDWRSLFDLD
jgi:hypothetical protein